MNRAYILNNSLQSIFDQTYPHWEIVIVDDGSTDDTKPLVNVLIIPVLREKMRNR
ncbi:glycosyltransferase family 2 protein [Candidatus Roizmanbacteria bacterium]|nr:glycosyltransferase family 2 protein [Candidatus Roizmanbacteria bacterium]